VYTTVEPPYADANASVIGAVARQERSAVLVQRVGHLELAAGETRDPRSAAPSRSSRIRTPSRTRGASSWATVPPPAPEPMMTMS